VKSIKLAKIENSAVNAGESSTVTETLIHESISRRNDSSASRTECVDDHDVMQDSENDG
jgi:hypothetical protein